MTNSPKGHPQLPSIVGVLLEEGGRWYRLRGDSIPARFFCLLLEDGRVIDRLLICDMHRANGFPVEPHYAETARFLAGDATHWPPVGITGLDGTPEPVSRVLEWPPDSPEDHAPLSQADIEEILRGRRQLVCTTPEKDLSGFWKSYPIGQLVQISEAINAKCEAILAKMEARERAAPDAR